MSKFFFVIIAGVALFSTILVTNRLNQPTQQVSFAANKSNSTPQQDAITDKVAKRTMDMTLDQASSMNLWDWEAGIALVGLMKTYERNHDVTILNFVDDWMKKRIQENEKPGKINPIFYPDVFPCNAADWVQPGFWHPNQEAPVWALLMLYRYRPSEQYLQIITNHINVLLKEACREDGTILHASHQVWDDTLAMSVPLLAHYGKLFYQPEVIDRAVDEFLKHAQYLQDPQTGLWFHGYSFTAHNNVSNGFWGRGNGWVIITATELLDALPSNHPARADIERILQRQLLAVTKLQDSSGMWHTVLSRSDFYLETSATSALSSGLLYASKMPWQSTNFKLYAERGVQAAYSKVSADGTVTGVSAGTGLPAIIDAYNGISTDQIKPYGQGIFMIMASRQ